MRNCIISNKYYFTLYNNFTICLLYTVCIYKSVGFTSENIIYSELAF